MRRWGMRRLRHSINHPFAPIRASSRTLSIQHIFVWSGPIPMA